MFNLPLIDRTCYEKDCEEEIQSTEYALVPFVQKAWSPSCSPWGHLLLKLELLLDLRYVLLDSMRVVTMNRLIDFFHLLTLISFLPYDSQFLVSILALNGLVKQRFMSLCLLLEAKIAVFNHEKLHNTLLGYHIVVLTAHLAY